jgi:hypothetical protein
MYDEDFSGHHGYDDCYMTEHWLHNGGKTVLLADFDYFRNLRRRAGGLDSDDSHNIQLGERKMLAGIKNSVGILRFEWKQILLDLKPAMADGQHGG